MKVQKIDVSRFRLFQEKTLYLEPGINFIVGENARGKTTWLEALYLLMAGKSFRTPQMGDLIQEGESFFRVEVHFEKWGVPQHLKMAQDSSERKLQYNASPLNSLIGLVGILQGVLLAPHDIELIKGAPSARRRYLDFQMAQVDPLYIHHLVRISRGIKQRNAEIRSGKFQAIDAFEEAIAHSAAYIIQEREKVSATLNDLLKEYYYKISGKNDPVDLKYHASLGGGTPLDILNKLRGHRSRDIRLGYTALGTHRDDLFFSISGKPARHFASEGEIRSIAWALRLAEWELIRRRSQEDPLLLVDDMGISLDPSRIKNLFDIFLNLGQVIITSSSKSHLINNYNFNIIEC